MKRFIFNNLVYKIDNQNYILINLISFRRQVINKESLDILYGLDNKLTQNHALTAEEKLILDEYYQTKQFLPQPIIDEATAILEGTSHLQLDKLPARSLTFNLTHKCNFKCEYCYQNAYKDKPKYNGFMTVNDIKLICDFLKLPDLDSSEIEEIIISGGESLLPSNIETINYICNNISSKKMIMFTNGVNLYEYRDRIDLNKFDEYQISLDGHDDVISIVNRSPQVFQKIIEGIKYVDSLNKEINIIVMWTKDLEKKLDEFLHSLHSEGITNRKNIKFRFTLAKNYYSENNLDTTFYDLEYVKTAIKKHNISLQSISTKIELFPEAATLSKIIHRPINKTIDPRIAKCDLTASIPLVFEPNGEIHWCICLGHENGIIGRYKNTMQVDTKKILELGERTIFKIPKCMKCDLKYVCGGGCPLYLMTIDQDINSPVCGMLGMEYFWNHLEEFI